VCNLLVTSSSSIENVVEGGRCPHQLSASFYSKQLREEVGRMQKPPMFLLLLSKEEQQPVPTPTTVVVLPLNNISEKLSNSANN
jgi:hypothetical protein